MEIVLDPFEDKQSPVFCICKRLGKAKFIDVEDVVLVDLTKSSFMQIGTLAVIAMLCNKSRSQNKKASTKYVSNSDLAQYMSRMNFFEVQNILSREEFTRHPSKNRFLEITKIQSDRNNNDLPEKLRDIVSEQSGVDASLIDALDFSFGEVIDNVENHARANIGGYVAAQFYPNKHYIEFCVVDDGIGIISSLQKNNEYSHLDGDELLLMAFNEGVGERVGPSFSGGPGHGCGFGLTFTARLVQATGGTLWVVSHENAALITEENCSAIGGMYFPGTVICARIPSTATVFESDLISTGADQLYSWNIENICNYPDIVVDDILW
ncbi:MAG: hypothetical protein RR547_04150 [Raoultibacter sp.]